MAKSHDALFERDLICFRIGEFLHNLFLDGSFKIQNNLLNGLEDYYLEEQWREEDD